MSLPPSIFNNEDGGIDNPFDDGENTPMWAMTPKPERGVVERTIEFDTTSLGSPNKFGNTRVITTQDENHVIRWSIPDKSVQVQRVVWEGYNKTTKPAGLQPIMDSNNTALSVRPMTYVPDSTEITLPVGINDGVSKWNGSDTYITIYWSASDRTGSTRSGVFTLCNGNINNDCGALVIEYNKKLENDAKARDGEEIPDNSDNVDAPSSTGTRATATPSSPGLGSLPTTAGTSDNTSNEGSGGGGGLPTGAIAGIVVGAVLGLALIAFLAWFFLRRRRRASNVSSGPGHGPHDYLADKETQARVTESPHSPYTDDGQHPPQQQFHAHNDQDAVLPASATSPTGRRSFAPYEEHTPIASRSVDNVNRDGARSSTPNVNSNVSHLIEDGMTEDEIRRLEEEERALDAAIEQAGQGQSGGRGQQRR